MIDRKLEFIEINTGSRKNEGCKLNSSEARKEKYKPCVGDSDSYQP